jgi:hypothetical protein
MPCCTASSAPTVGLASLVPSPQTLCCRRPLVACTHQRAATSPWHPQPVDVQALGKPAGTPIQALCGSFGAESTLVQFLEIMHAFFRLATCLEGPLLTTAST